MSGSLPYRLYAQSELRLLEAATRSRCEAWLADWQVGTAELSVTARPVLLADVSGQDWLWGEAGALALSDSAEAWSFFSRLCLGEDKGRAAAERSALATPVLSAARRALFKALCRADAMSDLAAIGSDALSPAFTCVGALRMELSCGGGRLVVLADASLAAELLPPRKPLPDLPKVSLQTLKFAPALPLEVRAAPARVTLEDLESLRPGDVLRLDQPINGMFELCLPGGSALGRARLGTSRGRAAVKLARLSTQLDKSGKS